MAYPSAMSETMLALRLHSLDGPDGLALESVAAPVPGPNQILIDVHAAGVGFPDLLMTQGRYQFRPEPPFSPGIEIAGTVRSAPGDTGFKPGDRVVANAPLGGWAEIAVAAPNVTFPIPEGMSFAQATSMVNYQTAVFALLERGGTKAGETVLIQGAAGGTGTSAIEVARAYGASVIAIARGEDKRRTCRELGAEHALEAEGDWLAEVKQITDNRGVDIVYDPVGGDRFLDSVRSMAVGGRLLVIGFAAGTIPEIKINRLLLRNTSLIGAAWGEWIRHDPQMPRRIATELDRLFADGKINPLVGTVYELADGAQALREIAERRAVGKIVLKIRD
jgi:NADPH2:quinone reductase